MKNICWTRRDHSIIIRELKIFSSDWKNVNDQARSTSAKIVDSKAVVQAIEANSASSSLRVLGEFGISENSVVCQLLDLSENIWNCLIVHYVIKILERF